MSKLPMNLPNRITLTRILLIPIVLALMVIDDITCRWLAAILFLLAALTDFVDGRLARSRGEITDFGKFIDPIADKLLVLLPLILLLWQGADVGVFAVLIMVAREIIVSGFRLVAASRNQVIAADASGKLKTSLQILAVAMLMLRAPYAYYVAWLAALLSAYSGCEILIKNSAALEENP